MRHALTLAISLMFASAGAIAAPAPAPAPATSANTPATQLHDLFAKGWSQRGHGKPDPDATGYKALWSDPSLAHVHARTAEVKANLAALRKIDIDTLSPTDQLSYRLFEYQLKDKIAAAAFQNQAQTLITQLWGPQLAGNRFKGKHFDNAEGYERLIRKLKAVDPYLSAFTARLKKSMDKGITQPRVVMKRVPDEIAANITDKPEDSPFYAPFKNMPDSIPAAKQAELQNQAKTAITDVVNPAYKQFLDFFKNDYLPQARDKAGVSNLSGGMDYYKYLVRHYTTTDMTPKQVHELGLKLVKQIHAQMQDVFDKIGFEGSYKEFVHHLRTDPKFYYSDPKELLKSYRAAAKRIDPHLVQILGVWLLPRHPWGVEVIPASLAPNTYPAYANVPYMSVNLYKPETRPKYSIQVLTCHEGRPGHNLQIPVASQLSNLPEFRRHAYYNAFGEGWALYSETLCDKPMGLYTDAYSKFGYLNYQMWRAVRLVVDTGIHAYGWNRDKAIKYMQDNTALANQNITTEVDRYIVWPGQALSYMIGEQTILKLRAEAKKKLGDKYSLKDFNDVVLGQGSLPMAVLTDVVHRWIDNTLAGKPADQLPFACKPRSMQPCTEKTGASK